MATLNNSGGKCLLENWVEERACSYIDLEKSGDEPVVNEPTEDQRLEEVHSNKISHKGIMSIDFTAPTEKLSTCTDSYRPPTKPRVRTIGKRHELLERELFEQISQDVQKENNPDNLQMELKSTTKTDFIVEGFEHVDVEPTMEHDLNREQPVTFWTEHVSLVHGVSQIKSKDTPFRKNDAFSTPIEDNWDEPKPYESEHYPQM